MLRYSSLVLIWRRGLHSVLEATTLDSTAPGPTMQGDFLAVRALAYACSGEGLRAQELVAASEECTDHIDARVVRAFASAVVALTTESVDVGEARKAVEAALSEAYATKTTTRSSLAIDRIQHSSR
jgi:hypothetical protein